MPFDRNLSLSLSHAERLREYIRCLDIKSNILKFNNQDYFKIKKQCIEENRLFCDDTFNNFESIKNINELKGYKIDWQRPTNITKDPKFKLDYSRGVIQGILGNCWLVAAFASLVSQKELWDKVVPFAGTQTFNRGEYAGIFVFRFWRFVVDDLLPTIENKLAFAHSDFVNEFWCALVEKAYAKINNGYENLEGGHVEALIHFSGGVPEYIELKDKNENELDSLWTKVSDAFHNRSLMTACIEARNSADIEKELPNGLLLGHSYAVTDLKVVLINNKQNRLIRMTNPWRKKEWNGKWGKFSKEWTLVSKRIKKKMNFTTDENGEFWMSFVDFYQEFSEIVICHNLNTTWHNWLNSFKKSSIYGYWRKPDRYGGCINNKIESFLSNPQYRFDVMKQEGDDVVICLTQKNKRSDWKRGLKNLHIGFYIMPIELNRTLRLSSIANDMRFLDTPLQNSESIMIRARLSFGRYCIIPHTFDKHQEGEFLLRIFTHKFTKLKELDTNLKFSKHNFSMPPQCATQIIIKNGFNLKYFMCPSFILISCEGEVVKSNILKAQKDPEWNISAIFYRRNYHLHPITVSLYALEAFGLLTREKYVGSVFLKAEPNDATVEFCATLSNIVNDENYNTKIKMNLVKGFIKSMREPYVL